MAKADDNTLTTSQTSVKPGDGSPSSKEDRFAVPVEQRIKGYDGKEVLKHFLFAVVIGVVGAAASIILCLCVNGVYTVFQMFEWLLWCLPILGVLSLLLYKVWKLPLDLTTHQVIIKMRKDEPVSPFLAPGILLGTCSTILCGGSVGKEAGALQMGASLGSLVSRPFHLKSVYKANRNESMNGYAASAGMAAAFSALFFAPIGSTFFVMELSRFKPSINKHFFSILFACFIAYFIASAIGIGDVIDKVAMPEASWPTVGQCLIVGISATVMGALFASTIRWVHDLTKRATKNYFVWVIVGGIAFALLVHFCGWYHLTGSGGINLNDALRGEYGSWDFAIKILLTIICLGFWFKGGEIMPSFCIGGLLGASCSIMSGGDATFGAALGAMTFFAAFSGCPIAAFFMGCEIFGFSMAPWLAIAIVVNLVISPSVSMFGANLDEGVRARWTKALRGSRHRYHNMQTQTAIENHTEVPGIVTNAQSALNAFEDAIKSSAEASSAEGELTEQQASKHDKS